MYGIPVVIITYFENIGEKIMLKKILVIPTYNEQDSIVNTISDIKTHCPDWDYVIINDGSNDDTLAVCRQHGFNVINLASNLGLAGAFQTGMLYAKENDYDYAMQFDADGQHLAKYVVKLEEMAIETGVDIVSGSRYVSVKKPFSARMFGSRLITAIIHITTGKLLTDPTSGMRLFNKKVINVLAKSVNCHPEPDTLAHLLRQKYKIAECQVEMAERTAGESYLNIFNGLSYTLNTVISIAFIQWFRKGD